MPAPLADPGALLPAPALRDGQQRPADPDLAALLRQLRSIGPTLAPDAVARTSQLCARFQRGRPCRAGHVERDLAYGPDTRQRLDVHRPARRARVPAPVLVFVHGGGFIGGDKHTPGLPFFDNAGGWAVRSGMVGITINYRLAPAHPWPAAAQDVAAALTWVRAQAPDLGGDPDRIVLMGHSAGAAHVAAYLSGQSGPVTDGLAAAVLLSGIYDLTLARRDASAAVQVEQLRAYFGGNDALDATQSALRGLVRSPVPMLFGVAELDPPLFQRQAGVVLDALLRRHGTLPPFAWLAGHNHFSQILTLGADPDGLAALLDRFLHEVLSRPRPGVQVEP